MTSPSTPGGREKAAWRRRKARREAWRKVLVFAVLTFGAVLFALPFVWMISTSLKSASEVMQVPPSLLPHKVVWSNYPVALARLDFPRLLRNTCVIVYSNLIGQTLSASLVAFGFARLRFPGREPLFFLMLSTMMLPSMATLIPVYALYKQLGWINTFLPLTLPAYLGGGAFYIFLLRQFFLTLPGELEDAARMDGCSSFDVYWRIFLPLSKPALATVAIFSFMGHWNDFIGPLIYLRTPDKYTLALGLQTFQGLYSTDYNYLMAASVVVVSPVILVFFAAQRYFVKGIVLSGLKG
ncbi:MAG TPA: carbohydrate ABC transporter permease [Armatimonadota bacterium]|jgi:ABC-type glycerol-3-phosphate transport system permease component